MARITVEDCLDKIANPFELITLASQRARDIGQGAPISVNRNADKNTVVALREIAARTLDLDVLKENVLNRISNSKANAQITAEIDSSVDHKVQGVDDKISQEDLIDLNIDDDEEDSNEDNDFENGMDEVEVKDHFLG